MKTDKLAYSYKSSARILASKGWTYAQIEAFLITHQTQLGYIRADLIDGQTTKPEAGK